MDWSDQPALPPLSTERTIGGIRRGVLTAMLGGLLLIGGGVAAVSAASPDPSTAPAPSTEVEPSDDGTAPTESTRPGSDCPDKGGSGDSSSS